MIMKLTKRDVLDILNEDNNDWKPLKKNKNRLKKKFFSETSCRNGVDIFKHLPTNNFYQIAWKIWDRDFISADFILVDIVKKAGIQFVCSKGKWIEAQ